MNLPIKFDHLKFGISSLHCWIRSMECFIHIAYRLEFKKWSKAGFDDELNRTKLRIQKEFFKRLGLHIDKPRSNAGNSNDGNTARIFFANAEVSAEITGIKLELLQRIRTILIAISCGEEIDPEAFKAYAHETARLYVRDYQWYYMPTTLHKLLIHGHEIINQAIIPIGRLSEEAQEAMNKEMRRLRRDHSRKNSRVNTMRDVFNGLLIASDPKVSQYRHGSSPISEQLPIEVKQLLRKHNEEE